MEILHAAARNPVRAVLFDFDGTISTLRCGWESVMKPLMLEMISGGAWDDALEREVDDYINESAGIQTIHQMKWLAEAVRSHGRNPGAPTDPWQYKAEYNRRLMQTVDILRDDGAELSLAFQRCKRQMRGVRLCFQRQHFLTVEAVKFLGVAVEKAVT